VSARISSYSLHSPAMERNGFRNYALDYQIWADDSSPVFSVALHTRAVRWQR